MIFKVIIIFLLIYRKLLLHTLFCFSSKKLLHVISQFSSYAINVNIRLLFRLIVEDNFWSCIFSLYFSLLNFTWLLFFRLLFNLNRSLFFLLILILLFLFTKMWRIDLNFWCFVFIPNNELLLIFSCFSHHLYDHKLFHCLCKCWTIFNNIF